MTSDREATYAAYAARLGTSPAKLRMYVRRTRVTLLAFVVLLVTGALLPGWVQTALTVAFCASLLALYVYLLRRPGARS